MKSFFKNSISVITIIFLSGLSAIAQQKETIVDFSSKQKPDTTYSNYNKPNTISTNSNEEVTETTNSSISTVSLDSIRKELSALRKEVDNNKNVLSGVQTNLYKSHKKFRLGMLLMIGGSIASSLGSAALANTAAGAQAPPEAAFLVLGGFGATVAGIVFVFNANKYLGKAGKSRGERYGSYRTSINY